MKISSMKKKRPTMNVGLPSEEATIVLYPPLPPAALITLSSSASSSSSSTIPYHRHSKNDPSGRRRSHSEESSTNDESFSTTKQNAVLNTSTDSRYGERMIATRKVSFVDDHIDRNPKAIATESHHTVPLSPPGIEMSGTDIGKESMFITTTTTNTSRPTLFVDATNQKNRNDDDDTCQYSKPLQEEDTNSDDGIHSHNVVTPDVVPPLTGDPDVVISSPAKIDTEANTAIVIPSDSLLVLGATTMIVPTTYAPCCQNAESQAPEEITTSPSRSRHDHNTITGESQMMRGKSLVVGCMAPDVIEECWEEQSVTSNATTTTNDNHTDTFHRMDDHSDTYPIPLSLFETEERYDVVTPKSSNVGVNRFDIDDDDDGTSIFVIKNKDNEYWSCQLCDISNLQGHSVDVHCNGRKHRQALETTLQRHPSTMLSPVKCAIVGRSPRKLLEECLAFQISMDITARSDPRFAYVTYNPLDSDIAASAMSWSCRICRPMIHGLKMKDIEPHCLGKKHTLSYQNMVHRQQLSTVFRFDNELTPISTYQSEYTL